MALRAGDKRGGRALSGAEGELTMLTYVMRMSTRLRPILALASRLRALENRRPNRAAGAERERARRRVTYVIHKDP